MTTSPAEQAVRPKLNTTNWSLPNISASREPEDICPGQSWVGCSEDKKEGHEHDNIVDAWQDSDRAHMEPLMSRSRESLGNMSSDMLEELRKIIKEESKGSVAQAAQVAQLKKTETNTTADMARFSPLYSQNSVLTPAYPSPPHSVIEPLNASKVSSPREESPEVTLTVGDTAAAVPLAETPAPTSMPITAFQSTPPVSPRPRAVHFRRKGPPVIQCQPRVDSEPESVSPTTAGPQSELSSVDKAWGVLFDSEGFPTQRLNSVLRGLAVFMIAEFGTPETMVVTPEKMLALYTKYKVEPERFQYEDVFRSRSKDALERIEFLYQDLDCQYHLLQAAPRSRPSIPGLTPIGFAKWMINNILAYPDIEAKRLHDIISELPVNADGPLAEGKAERLPKQLSRHLFPEYHDKKLRRILDEAMWDCLDEDITSPLPAIPRAKQIPTQEAARVPEANTHFRRSSEDRKRPVPIPDRSRTYDRGSHRADPHPPRLLPRSNSDAGSSLRRHRDLPPPPVGRHSIPQRQRSPPLVNRYSASLPALPQHLVVSSPEAQPTQNLRGGEGNYGVYSGREGREGREPERDESPRSSGLGRRGPGADRRLTWEDVYSRKGASGKGPSADARSFR
ncbi:hypothetical protein CCHL11_01566 [Colletotrichum chlorophyti]|uniref:DUF7514 domain-containing protein n=1 Tax=Colletotrichum chlorophyti TaxID=708187 RepID=A0A1Q8RYB8_9PEZI|nr:hypothetical protein CCHL11_01566 [Colletotrichum chlorophyti]